MVRAILDQPMDYVDNDEFHALAREGDSSIRPIQFAGPTSAGISR